MGVPIYQVHPWIIERSSDGVEIEQEKVLLAVVDRLCVGDPINNRRSRASLSGSDPLQNGFQPEDCPWPRYEF
jgi:hypothetical protein